MGRVLIGGETSGTVREAFRRRGHEAYSCDLLPAQDGSPHHFQMDMRNLFIEGAFDLFIAHPDCTYLTNSAAWAFGDGPYHQKVKPGTLVGAERRAAREAALRFVSEVWAAPFDRIAMENPPGSIGTRLMQATQYIQPHEFGADASKKTGLWLKNLPPLKADPKNRVEGRLVCCGETIENIVKGCPFCRGVNRPVRRWANQTNSGQNRLSPGVNRWQVRSNTYPGWAEAMAEQWGPLLP